MSHQDNQFYFHYQRVIKRKPFHKTNFPNNGEFDPSDICLTSEK